MGILFSSHRQAQWLSDIDHELVQSILPQLHSCQQLPTRLADAHHPLLDVDVVAALVELPHAHYVHCELCDVVDPDEHSVLSVLAHEQHRPAPFNLRHRLIAEPHHPAHHRV
jgi:hypothetical protein